MTIDWLKLGAALVLLLVPIALFHGAKVRYRPIARDWVRHWLQVLTLGAHTIDFGRAVLGGWLLADAFVIDPVTRGATRHTALLVQAVVLGLAVLLQTIVCKERDTYHAPFTFVTGVLTGFLWELPAVPAFAVLFAVVVAIGARTPTLYFVLLGASSIVTGKLFAGTMSPPLIAVAAVVMLPPLLSIMFRRPLMISYRAKRPSDSRPPVSDASDLQSPGP